MTSKLIVSPEECLFFFPCDSKNPQSISRVFFLFIYLIHVPFLHQLAPPKKNLLLLEKRFHCCSKKKQNIIQTSKSHITGREKSTERHLIMRGSNIHRSHPSKWLFNYKQYVLVDTEKTQRSLRLKKKTNLLLK